METLQADKDAGCKNTFKAARKCFYIYRENNTRCAAGRVETKKFVNELDNIAQYGGYRIKYSSIFH